MKQFRAIPTLLEPNNSSDFYTYEAKEAEYAADRDMPIFPKLLEALTPVLLVFLTLLIGLVLFVIFTMNAPAPMRNTTPGPNNALAYGDSRYYAYIDIFNVTSYKKLTTSRPSTLGYSLYISCVEYHSQLACDQFDLLQQTSEKSEQRKGT